MDRTYVYCEIKWTDSPNCIKCQWACPNCLSSLKMIIKSNGIITKKEPEELSYRDEVLAKLDHIDESKTLTSGDRGDIMTVLLPILNKYRELGMQLHIPASHIKSIEFDTIDCRSRMNKMIEEWLNWKYDTVTYGLPTFKLLKGAMLARM